MTTIQTVITRALQYLPPEDPGDEPWYSQALAEHYEDALNRILDHLEGRLPLDPEDDEEES